MAEKFDLFKSRISNSTLQIADLIEGNYFNDTEVHAFGVTTKELWGTAKFQFEEAKKLADTLEGEEKAFAEFMIKWFKIAFRNHLSRLE